MSVAGAFYKKQGKLETLQILRAIAAILIMVKHALYEVDLISPIDFNYGNSIYYTVGIDIFFVLSGFIIVYTAWGRDTGFKAAKTFMLRRFLRIVPIYWFYTFLIAAVAIIMPQVLDSAEFVLSDFFKSLLFIPYINTAGDLQPILANGWSLNYEMYFYLIFAICLIFPTRINFLILATFFAVTVGTDFLSINNFYTNFYSNSVVFEFMAGAFIGYAYLKGFRLPAYFIYIGGAFLALSLIALLYTDTLIDSIGMQHYKPVVGFLSVLLLALPKNAENLRMPKWSVLLGDASYTIYLSHSFGIGAVTQLVLLFGYEAHLSPWLIFGAVFFVCIIGGIIAYLLIEKPLLSASKRLMYREKTQN